MLLIIKNSHWIAKIANKLSMKECKFCDVKLTILIKVQAKFLVSTLTKTFFVLVI